MSEFTLHDVTQSMHSGRKIRHIDWPQDIHMHFKDGVWEHSLIPEFLPTFIEVEKWEYYKEPKKTVKKTFYKAYRYNKYARCVYDTQWLPNKKIEGLDIVLNWMEKEFEIPEDE